MAHGIATIEVKRSRGKLVVQGLGRTPRGQKFIRAKEELAVKSPADPAFKDELAKAVAKLMHESPSTL